MKQTADGQEPAPIDLGMAQRLEQVLSLLLERQTDRQTETERQRDRERNRQTDRQTETDRERQRRGDRDRKTETERGGTTTQTGYPASLLSYGEAWCFRSPLSVLVSLGLETCLNVP